MDAKGNVIYKPMKKELNNANEKIKNLENFTEEIKTQNENNKKQAETFKKEISDLEQKLIEQRKAQSKKTEEQMEKLEAEIQKLKEENLSIKIGKFKLKDIMYNDIKDSLCQKQDRMLETLDLLNKQFESGIGNFTHFNSLLNRMMEAKEKENAAQVKTADVNARLSLEVTEKMEEIVVLNDKLQKERKLVRKLQENLEDQKMIGLFKGFINRDNELFAFYGII